MSYQTQDFPMYYYTEGRPYGIKNIIVHHTAGVMTAQSIANTLNDRGVSANYCIGSDGIVGTLIEDWHRAWHAGDGINCCSKGNDCGIGIEVSNDTVGGDWHVSDRTFDILVELCHDIVVRNGLLPLKRGVNVFGHRDCSATAPMPINKTELLTKNGWKKLADIQIGEEIASVRMDDLGIEFSPVLNVLEPFASDTYEKRDFEATYNHRALVYPSKEDIDIENDTRRVLQWGEVCGGNTGKDGCQQFKIPNAGIYNGKGIEITDDELRLLIAIQADGHYMYEDRKKINGKRVKTEEKTYYGVEFHLSKDRKINRIQDILDACGYEYSVSSCANGSSHIRVYGKEILDFANKYLDEKKFSWKFLELSQEQATVFLEEILLWDGCVNGNDYSSYEKQNIDIVSAIASMNGVGIRSNGDNRISFTEQFRSIENGTKATRKKSGRNELVSCVTVNTGFILVRQNGRTTITGNCPGPYLYDKLDELCDRVNNFGKKPEPTPVPQPEPTPEPREEEPKEAQKEEEPMEETEKEVKKYEPSEEGSGIIYNINQQAEQIETNEMTPLLPQKVYETLRWVLWVVFPALGVFLTTLTKAWGWDIPLEAILITMSGLSLFIGTVLGIAKVKSDK